MPHPRPPGLPCDPALAPRPVLTLFLQAGELETLKQSSRLVHYCATALLFDPAAWLHGPPETSGPPEGQVRLQTLDFSGRTSVPSPLIGWLPVGRVSLNLHSNSGAIALSRPLEAENPLPTATPWTGLRWAPGRSLG